MSWFGLKDGSRTLGAHQHSIKVDLASLDADTIGRRIADAVDLGMYCSEDLLLSIDDETAAVYDSSGEAVVALNEGNVVLDEHRSDLGRRVVRELRVMLGRDDPLPIPLVS